MSYGSPFLLVVDDDTSILDLLYEVLSPEGFTVETCISARQALHAMSARTPDLIILDIQLERPNAGVLVLLEMQERRELHDVPVIICSTSLQPLFPDCTPPSNVRAIVEKPFDIDDLLQTVVRNLNQSGLAVDLNQVYQRES